jgi:hypothetical protein
MTKDDKNSAVTAWLMMSSTGGDAHAQVKLLIMKYSYFSNESAPAPSLLDDS